MSDFNIEIRYFRSEKSWCFKWLKGWEAFSFYKEVDSVRDDFLVLLAGLEGVTNDSNLAEEVNCF